MVAWDDEAGATVTFWNGVEPLKGYPVGDFVRRAIERNVNIKDARNNILGPEPPEQA